MSGDQQRGRATPAGRAVERPSGGAAAGAVPGRADRRRRGDRAAGAGRAEPDRLACLLVLVFLVELAGTDVVIELLACLVRAKSDCT